MRILFLGINVGLFVTGIISCGPGDRLTRLATDNSGHKPRSAPYDDSFQAMSADKLQRYRGALPKVAFKKLDRILQSPKTFWYDDETIVPAYQDSVGDGRIAPIGARANARGHTLSLPAHLFDKEHWKFPFGHTAGTDNSTNIEVVNFIHLPDGPQGRLPIVYWIERNRRHPSLGDVKWKWMFPKGTVVGELIYITAPDGKLYPSELRTRTRYLRAWATNVYRPFTEAKQLAEAIKSRRSDWQELSQLQQVVTHLESGSMSASNLSSRVFPGVFSASGHLDLLPEFGDTDLVAKLLTETPFHSAYGKVWREQNGQKTFAPASSGGFSIVPNNYRAGLLEVREQTCKRCHQDAGRAISNFDDNLVLYGDIWGEDRVFSFNPYDSSRFSNFNTENRRVRPDFAQAGMVVRYNEGQHPADLYREITKGAE